MHATELEAFTVLTFRFLFNLLKVTKAGRKPPPSVADICGDAHFKHGPSLYSDSCTVLTEVTLPGLKWFNFHK